MVSVYLESSRILLRARNNICFEKKLVRSPAEIICFALSFVSLWAELHRQEHRVALEAGAEALK